MKLKPFRFGATLGLILCSFLPGLTYAQTPVVSDGVSVRNSDPQNVFFMFPVSTMNEVFLIQFGCSTAAVNRDNIYVYGSTPDWSGTFIHVGVNCNISFSDPNHPDDVFSGSLTSPVTVHTPGHTITINTAIWTAALKSSRSGYYWSATSGQAQITVQ